MRNQSVRLFVYSSLAIVALTLVWGIRQIPRQGALAENQLRSGLEQELIVLSSAVRSSTSALKYRLLDVLKAEGGDHPSRTFKDSIFVGAALLEWDSSQWKVLWRSSKIKDEFGPEALRKWMKEWPLAKISTEESFFARVGDYEGQPHFALITPVRRPNNTPMLGIGIFPASEFGLVFSADHSREVRVFDNKGFALALARPAYLGSNLKRESLVAEMLEGDMVTLSQEWKSESGVPTLGLAVRMSDSNLFASVQSKLPLGFGWVVQAWLYLILCAAGAVGLNWFLFSNMLRPLLLELESSEVLKEKLLRELSLKKEEVRDIPVVQMPKPVQGETPIPPAALPLVDFAESFRPEPQTHELKSKAAPLSKVVSAALRNLEPRLQEANIQVHRIDLESAELEGDFLQLQTAIEEVLKNAIESMSHSTDRQLTIAAHNLNGKLRLSVEDTGCGIQPENIGRVFDPFFSTKDSEGVARGLGLNVVRRVVEELKGSVRLSNKTDGPGTIVEMEWPTQKNAETIVEEIVARVEAPTSLDFLGDPEIPQTEEFSSVPPVPIRKPKVRTLD